MACRSRVAPTIDRGKSDGFHQPMAAPSLRGSVAPSKTPSACRVRPRRRGPWLREIRQDLDVVAGWAHDVCNQLGIEAAFELQRHAFLAPGLAEQPAWPCDGFLQRLRRAWRSARKPPIVSAAGLRRPSCRRPSTRPSLRRAKAGLSVWNGLRPGRRAGAGPCWSRKKLAPRFCQTMPVSGRTQPEPILEIDALDEADGEAVVVDGAEPDGVALVDRRGPGAARCLVSMRLASSSSLAWSR